MVISRFWMNQELRYLGHQLVDDVEPVLLVGHPGLAFLLQGYRRFKSLKKQN